MRYEDASLSGSFQASSAGPDARDDTDAIPAGARGPATGNTISGAGTISGSAGADSASGGRIVAVEGAGGRDADVADGMLRVGGEHGTLSISPGGDYRYVPRAGTPENARDVFTYTLANAAGETDRARLIIEIGKTPAEVRADAQRIVPGPDGVVVLPAGVDLSDIRVVGSDLLVMLPDGQQLIIVDGAVFVPQLVIGNVEVPATNLAALLIDAEPQPAAGNPQSSGGNFAVPVAPLGPGEALGDLLPPTELGYTPPDFRDPGFSLDDDDDDNDRDVEIGENAVVQLDDDVLPGGNPGGVGDDPDSENSTGFLSGNGGNGQLTFDLLTTGAPSGFTYEDGPDGSVLVRQGGTLVLTITVDAETGEYSVTQNAPILHPAGGDENNVVLTLSYTVTDRDGDSRTGSLTINVDDDTPVIDVAAGADDAVTLVTDDADTVGGNSDTASSSADFGGVFDLSFSPGADGTDAAPVLSYALGTVGGASGLTSHGAAINLYLIDGVVVGSTAGSAAEVTAGNTVFDVSVDGTGVVTLNQYSQIDHSNTDPSPTGAPFNDQLISLVDSAITLTATASYTDRDGDPASDSATVGIGANLQFSDDGPSLTGVRATSGVLVDETWAGSPSGFPISNTSESPMIRGTALFGADGPAASGSLSTSISINGTGATPLQTAIGDYPITLVQNGPNEIIGQYDDGSGVQTAFTVTLNANGTVTLVQNVPLEHLVDGPPGPAHNDPLSLSGLINGNITATDFDGDTASASVDIGSRIVFRDDGPSVILDRAQNGTLILTTQDAETVGAAADTATLDFSTNINFGGDPGADGGQVLPLSFALSTVGGPSGLTQGGVTINLFLIGGVVVGSTASSADAVTAANTVFDVSTTSAGVVTLTQYTQVDHPPQGPGNPDPNPNPPFDAQIVSMADELIILTATATVIDNDGDIATQTLDLEIGANLQFADDGPVAVADTDVVLEGETTATGNVITDAAPGDAGDSDNGADNVGADVPGRITAIAFGSTVDSSFDADGNLQVQGQYGTLTIDAAGNYTYTVTSGAAGGQSEVFTYTLTDADGDSAAATLTIGITDTAPVAGSGSVLLDDDALPGGNAGGPNDVSPDTQNTSGLLPGGGSGGLNWSFAGAQAPLPPGFAYDASTPGTLVITQNGVAVVTVTITDPATGAYTIVQNNPILHEAGASGTSNENNIDFTISYVVTDGDGDAAQGSIAIQVNDDSPVIDVSLQDGAAEPALATQDAETVGDASDTAVSSANFGGVFTLSQSAGADGAAAPASLQYSLATTGGASGLTSHGAAINLFLVGGVVVGSTAADAASVTADNTVFSVSVSGDGEVTLTQFQQIDHAPEGTTGAPFDDQSAGLLDSAISLTASATLTDADGDTVTDSATVDIGANLQFSDDGPTLTNVRATSGVMVDETWAGTPSGFPISNTSESAMIRGSALFGADGPAGTGSLSTSISINGTGATPLQTAIGDYPVTLVQNGPNQIIGQYDDGSGVQTAFTVTLNANGTVTLVQNVPLEHLIDGPSGTAHNDSLSLSGLINGNITATDFDGDTASASVEIGSRITFRDDGPSAFLDHAQNGTLVLLTQDADTIGAASDSATVDFSGVVRAAADAGADGGSVLPISYALGTVGGASGLTQGGVAINLFLIGGVVVGSTATSADAVTAANTVFDVSTTSGGVVTLTQYSQVDHPPEGPSNPDPNPVPGFDAQIVSMADELITLSATVTVVDNDGDFDTKTLDLEIGANLQFADDGPVLASFEDAALANAAGAEAHGDFGYQSGGDGHSSFAITGPALAGVSYSTVQNADGALLTATADADGAGGADPVTLFTLQVNSSGSYDFTLVTPEASTTETVPLLRLNPGGPKPFVQTADGRIEFTGSGNGVNSSQQGFGVDNQFVGKGESFTIEFHAQGAAGNQAADVDAQFVTSATLKNDMINGSLTVQVTFHNDATGESEVQTIAVTGSSTLLDPTSLSEFNRVEIEGVDGTKQGVRFTSLEYSKTILPPDTELHFGVQATDADGDESDVQSFTVTVDSTPSSNLSGLRLLEPQSTTNATVFAAVAAAAGLAALPAAAHPIATDHAKSPAVQEPHELVSASLSSAAPEAGHAGESVSLLKGHVSVQDDSAAHASRVGSFEADGATRPLDRHSAAHEAAPVARASSDSGDAPVQHAPAPAQEIAMPSPEALSALMGKSDSVDGDHGGKHDGAVQRVIAEALNGGGGGPDIDALLAHLPDANAVNGGENPATDGAASHPAAAVPGWDSGHFAGLSHGPAFLMEAAVLHHDAVQPA